MSPIFEGFSGSINRQLMFRQRCGKTIVSKFPNRSTVIYSENQKREQRRFADAVSFARIVISDKVLFTKYSIQATLLGFRSAWNVAIAEYMSVEPLDVKPKKIRFEKSLITDKMGKHICINLSKRVDSGLEQLARQIKVKVHSATILETKKAKKLKTPLRYLHIHSSAHLRICASFEL